jgi:hypothetical protein
MLTGYGPTARQRQAIRRKMAERAGHTPSAEQMKVRAAATAEQMKARAAAIDQLLHRGD